MNRTSDRFDLGFQNLNQTETNIGVKSVEPNRAHHWCPRSFPIAM